MCSNFFDFFFHNMITFGLICLNHNPNKDHLLHLTTFEVVLNPPLIVQFEIYLQPDKNITWGFCKWSLE